MEEVPPGGGAMSPDFTGMDPEQMQRFIAELEHARGVIGENIAAIRQEFLANGVPATSLGPLLEIEQWIDERLPELRRRDRLARDMAWLPGWAPGTAGGLVGYDETAVLPPAEARRLDTELAGRYRAIDPDPFLDFAPGADDAYRAIVAELAAHAYDAEFTAAFFAAIGADRTIELPARLRKWLPEGQEEAVATVSRAFGVAVTAGMAVGGFAAIAQRAHDATSADAGDAERAGVGDLLSAGRFPTEWLAQTVANQVLLPGPGLAASGPALTPYLTALANNPAAARLALSLASTESPLPKPPDLTPPLPGDTTSSGTGTGDRALGDRRPDLPSLLKQLNDRASFDAASADAFGRLLASASGAYDEKDGAHTDGAARFAFTVITTADEMRLGDATRVHLAELAGSYASEITAGANFGDADHLEPSAYTPADTGIAGLTASFRLSPADTYHFLKTFAGTDPDLAPFHTAMGDLTQRLVTQGVPALRTDGDPTALDPAFAALGNVAGLELAAAESLRQRADDIAERRAKDDSFVTGTMFTVAGLGIGVEALSHLWDTLSTGYSAWDTYKADPPTQVDQLHAADDQQTLGRQHAVASSLLNAGLPAKVSPAAFQAAHPTEIPIADDTGNLRPFADIAKSGEPGLRALDAWLIANGMGGDDKLGLGELSSRFADRFDGRKQHAERRARLLEN